MRALLRKGVQVRTRAVSLTSLGAPQVSNPGHSRQATRLCRLDGPASARYSPGVRDRAHPVRGQGLSHLGTPQDTDITSLPAHRRRTPGYTKEA